MKVRTNTVYKKNSYGQIQIICNECGGKFEMSGKDWIVDIRGTWDFHCPCGDILRINPKRVREQNYFYKTKENTK